MMIDECLPTCSISMEEDEEVKEMTPVDEAVMAVKNAAYIEKEIWAKEKK